MPRTTEHARDLPVAALFPFVILSFGLAWGLIVLLVAIPETVIRIFGPVSAANPLFILAVYAPAIAGGGLVLARTGLPGLGRFLGRLRLWRVAGGWWAVLLIGIPAIYYAGAWVGGTLPDRQMPFDNMGAALSAMAFMLVLGPMEEFGWRGVALPLLQRRMAPIWAGLVLGGIWGVWHLPAFFLSGTPQSAWAFTPFLIGSVAVSVILTPIFNAGRGSLLLPVLFHFQLNNPLWPDAQPYDTVFFVLLAAMIVWINRAAMFDRAAGWQQVVPETA